MSDEQSIRDDIARALFIASDDFAFADRMAKAWDGPGPHGRARWYRYADALSPVVRRIQAEALREAAAEMDAGVSHLNANHPGELAYINCTRIDAQELRYRADRIERGETA